LIIFILNRKYAGLVTTAASERQAEQGLSKVRGFV
jgi:hypothetical protein